MFWMSDAFLTGLIEEDLHLVDLTSLALGLEGCRGEVVASPKKALAAAAGTEAAARIFRLAGCEAEVLVESGFPASAGEPLLKASGQADRLHAVYKTAQNVMECSSGIACRCRLMAQKAKGASPGIEILVTRKHMPGAKRLSLAAALAGGASIHRTGLSDSILVFDQHREFIGGIEGLAKAIPDMRRRFPEKKLAAEVATGNEALILAKAGIDILQLERFSPADMAETVKAAKAARPETAIIAAGGVSADNCESLAST